MTKKVLILSGSPRKGGNSDLLCDEFMRGAIEAGHKVEKGVIYGTGVYQSGEAKGKKVMQDLLSLFVLQNNNSFVVGVPKIGQSMFYNGIMIGWNEKLNLSGFHF